MEVVMHNVKVKEISKRIALFAGVTEWRRDESNPVEYYLSCKLVIGGKDGEQLCVTLFSEDYGRPIADLIGASKEYKEEVI